MGQAFLDMQYKEPYNKGTLQCTVESLNDNDSSYQGRTKVDCVGTSQLCLVYTEYW